MSHPLGTARSTFPVGRAVELAVAERSGFIESRHAGSAVVLRPDGGTGAVYGAPDCLVAAGAADKVLRAVALAAAGAPGDGAAAAIAAGDHAGSRRHRATVQAMLAQAGLSEAALRCPAPHGAGEAASPAAMGCSGTHAAMLAACRASGWDTAGYLAPGHPLQRHIVATVERLTGVKASALVTGVCGAPLCVISLAALARGVHQVATASGDSPFALYRHAAAVRRAILANGWALAGPGAPVTAVIDRLGVLMQVGREGTAVAAAPDGTTAAVKILDGSGRASVIVALALLVDAGALPAVRVAAILPLLGLDVHGGERVVGSIHPSYVKHRGASPAGTTPPAVAAGGGPAASQ